MIHPHTRIQHINDEIGYGVFATQLLRKGTIIYVKDCLEIEILPKDFDNYTLGMKEHIEKYSYMDERGIRVLSWDFAKYVNHCCQPNTLSTAYGFDIAVQDILIGEEITCDYGTLNVDEEMNLTCQKPGCRGILKPSDFENYYPNWDMKIKSALAQFSESHQPLLPFVEVNYAEELDEYFADPNQYKSILNLKFWKEKVNGM